MNQSHAYDYHHNDDKLFINSGAQSLPIVAPAEPKSKHLAILLMFRIFSTKLIIHIHG